MKIIDCFIFYNELDLLTYRLNLLNNIVDYFIIVESTHTFIGKEKKLFFNDNKHLFVDEGAYFADTLTVGNTVVFMNELLVTDDVSKTPP